jgi:hypothetical protein
MLFALILFILMYALGKMFLDASIQVVLDV